MKSLLIIGASGHGKVVADIAENLGYERIAFLDDNASVTACGDYSVIGASKDAYQYKDSDFFVAIGNVIYRERIYNDLKQQNLHVVSLIHPHAVIARDVFIEEGTVVMAGVVINPGTKIGKCCIVNTGATIDHDNCIGDYVHVSVGSHLAGTVEIGERSWIGAGAVVSNNISICGDVTLGAGAVVVKHILESGTYIGVPAKRL